MAEGSGEVSLADVETAFRKFAVHGDTKATGKEMNGKNFIKLCKDCKVIDGKTVTSTDVDIIFSKVKYDYPHNDWQHSLNAVHNRHMYDWT